VVALRDSRVQLEVVDYLRDAIVFLRRCNRAPWCALGIFARRIGFAHRLLIRDVVPRCEDGCRRVNQADGVEADVGIAPSRLSPAPGISECASRARDGWGDSRTTRR
jgi:hypothetical protein